MRKSENLLFRKEDLANLEHIIHLFENCYQFTKADSYDYQALYDSGVAHSDVSISDLHWYKFNYEIDEKNAAEYDDMCEALEKVYTYIKKNHKELNIVLDKYNKI